MKAALAMAALTRLVKAALGSGTKAGLGVLSRLAPGRPQKPVPGALPAILPLLALAALLLLSSRCTREMAPRGEQGGLGLTWSLPQQLPASAADTLRLWVLDAAGGTVAGPLAVPLDSARAGIDLSLRIPAGEGRRVWLQAEGWSRGVRGVLASGEAGGITVASGATAEARVQLHPTLPVLEVPDIELGALSYRVSWSRVPGADGYELHEIGPDGDSSISVADTFSVRLLQPAAGFAGTSEGSVLQGRAVGASDTTYYCVRCRFPQGGARSFRDPSWGGFSPAKGILLSQFTHLPRVTGVLPPPGATGVDIASGILVAFDRPMDESTLSDTTATLEEVPSGLPVAVRLGWRGRSDTLVVTPASRLAWGAAFRFRLRTDLRDLERRPLDQDPATMGLQGFQSDFGTEPYNPLRVVSVDPPDGSREVEPRAILRVTFNRGVDPLTVCDGCGSLLLTDLSDPSGGEAPLRLTLTQDSIVTAVPVDSLAYGADYRLTVTPGVHDLRPPTGDPLDQDPSTPALESFTSLFSTRRRPVGPRVVEVDPPDGERNAAVFRPARLRFSRPVRLETVICGDCNHLTIRGEADGVASSPPVQVGESRTLFEVSVRSDYHLTHPVRGRRFRIAVASAVLDDEGVPFDQDSTTAGNQEFSSIFWMEDNPRVVDPVPADGAAGVATDAAIVLHFQDEQGRPIALAPATIDGSNLVLELQGLAVPLAPPSFSADTATVTLRPLASLEHRRQYTVRADTTILSSRGSRLDQLLDTPGYQGFQMRFTTRAESIPPQVVASSPQDGETGVRRDMTASVRFQRPVLPGTVHGGGNATFFLQKLLADSSAVAVAASVAVAPDSLSATLSPAEPLEYSGRFRMTVTGLITDRFHTVFDQDPITPGRQSFTAVFETETAPPQILSILPAPGARVLPEEAASIALEFSEPMDTSSVAPPALLVYRAQPDSAEVEGTLTHEADLRRFHFHPAQPFSTGSDYRVTAGPGLVSASGVPFDQDPQTPADDSFRSGFHVDALPHARASAAVCDTLDSGLVAMDASGSFDSDGELLSAVWDWGDGRADSLPLPEGFTVTHQYDCLDVRGCGAGECDRSYRILLTVRDDDGLRASDTTGVSFCAFEVLSTVPSDGAAGVPDTLSEVRLLFSRALDAASLGEIRLRSVTGDTVAVVRSLDPADPARAVLALPAPLAAGSTYRVQASTGVLDLRGRHLGEGPCNPDAQGFLGSFTTRPAPPQGGRPHPQSESPQEGSPGGR